MGVSRAVRYASLLLSALSAGVLFGTRTSLGPSTQGFGYRTYVDVQQATVRNLRPVMGPLLPGAVVANLLLVVLVRVRRSPGFGPALAGLVGQLTSLLLTAAVELPINAQVLAWSTDTPPEGWEAVRDRWARVHTLRTATSVLGLGCLLAADLSTER